MQEQLHVVLAQVNLVWEDAKKNRRYFEENFERLPEETDIVVLPEMFTTGFTMSPENIAETMEGESIQWMKKMAEKYDFAIVGSLVIKEDLDYYNRLVFVSPDGAIEHYDKRHTFTLAGEDKVYTAGNHKLIVHYKGWKICPLICYDLRFPVWSRNIEDYDLLIYVANWPKKRITAWDTLLKARAIENMAYTIGVNRIGLDANDHEYTGHSDCYDVLGNSISSILPDQEIFEMVTLERSHLQEYRKKLQFLNDRDHFYVTN